MVDNRYQGRCGSCELFIKAVDDSLNDGFLRIISNNGIRRDETRFMHSTDFDRAGVICLYNDGKMVKSYLDKPFLCEYR
jgi:hypothetical protein